jgi:hypothetical protein
MKSKTSGLRNLQKDDNVLLWVYGADFLSGTSTKELTGFGLTPVSNRRTRAQLEISDGELAGTLCGKDLRGIPVFAVEDEPDLQVRGYYRGTSEIGFALKKFTDWTSVFYGSLELPSEIIRAIATELGVFVYMDSDDVLHTDGRFFTIHASSSGEKILKLPLWSTVKDAFTGITLAEKATEYVFQMQMGQTKWLLVEPVGD